MKMKMYVGSMQGLSTKIVIDSISWSYYKYVYGECCGTVV